jgi:signal transduction histidine kinase
VPTSVAAAAYRILQEALTNAARHGAGGAQIAVRFRHPALTLSVVNPIVDGRDDDGGGDRERGGLGLIGMRERAALLGGTLEAHARDGHFHLHARLPYGEAPA